MNDLPSWLQIFSIPMPATLGAVNGYLLRGPDGVALVDTGVNDASAKERLLGVLARNGLGVDDVSVVVCTHHHVDHSGLGGTFQEAGAEVWMSREDTEILLEFYDHPELDEKRSLLYGRHGLPEELAHHIKAVYPFFRSLGKRFVPTVIPDDRDQLSVAGIDFELIRLPGHTPGHIALFQREAEVVFTGDAVISKRAIHIDAGGYPRDGVDPLKDYLGSLDKLIALGAVRALPGHGSVIGDLGKAAADVKSHLGQRLDSVRDTLTDEPKTAFEIAEEWESVSTATRTARALPRWIHVGQTVACLIHLASTGSAEPVETPEGRRYRSVSSG